MDTPVLVTEHIEVGRKILERLDARGLPVAVALWYRRAEAVMWRFAVATTGPDADSSSTVRAVNEAVADVPRPPSLRSFDIEVMGPRDPMVLDLRVFHGTDPAPFVGGHWTGGTLGGQYMDEIYLYRAERLVPHTGTVPVRFAVRDNVARRWVTTPGTLTFTAGRLTALTSEPGAARTRPRRHGLSARFYTIDGQFTHKRQTAGHLRQWQFSAGRLEVFREDVRPVPVAEARPAPPVV